MNQVNFMPWQKSFLVCSWIRYANEADKNNLDELAEICLKADEKVKVLFDRTVDALQVLDFTSRERAQSMFGINLGKLLKLNPKEEVLRLYSQIFIALEKIPVLSEELNEFSDIFLDFCRNKVEIKNIESFCDYTEALARENLSLSIFFKAFKNYVEKRKIPEDIDFAYDVRRGSEEGELRQVFELSYEHELKNIDNLRALKMRRIMIYSGEFLLALAKGIFAFFW